MERTKLNWLNGAAVIPVLVGIGLSSPAYAQVFEDEIIVTATKRAESVQDVAISVTALSEKQIKALGYTNAQQITALAPGVSTVQPNGESNYSVAIRGASNSDFTTNVESPVALYVDETYISQSSGSGFQLFDTERVEILRGPQGTLFGRNATGGLVHYISVKPQEEFGGYVNASYGSYDRIKVQGALNAPISDTVAARVSFATHQGDGYVENRLRPDRSLNNANDVAGRAQLSFKPTDDFDLLLAARYGSQDIRTGFFEYVSAPLPTGAGQPSSPNPAIGGYTDLDGDIYAGSYDFPGRNQLETYSFTATGNYRFGDSLELTSITDYQSTDRDYIEDSDASPFNFFNFFLTTDAKQFSQEIRLSGSADKFKWVAGGYYINIDIDDQNGGIAPGFIANFVNLLSGQNPSNVDFDNLDAEVANAGFNGVDNPYTQETESFSIFGQVDYDLSDQLTLILGGRFISESKDFQYNNNGVLFDENATSGRDPRTQLIAPDLVPSFTGDRSDEMWSLRAVLNYQVNDDLLLYGGYNRGVRGGGFNAPLLPGIIDASFYEYEPETLNAYEAGFKKTFADGRARLNASAYFYDYTDYQAFSIIGLDTFTQNANAENYGFEAELQANPAEGLDVLLGVGYINSNVSDVAGVNTDAIASDGSLISAAFRQGDIVPVQTPEWNLNGLVRYEVPVSNDYSVAFQADAEYRSEHVFNLSGAASSIEDGYAVVNGSVTLSPEEQPWDLAVGVSNIFGEEYLVQTFDLSGTLDAGGFFGMIEQYYGRPRMWNVSLNVDF
ncbi:TonB-dependent receptor [Hellea balneolensis]|uniref:TonB-dependent receptor n=1 Tax=Hellea balneolensis TaxID=287478 RepID=UPI00047A6B03|nr:TonB-dependent receptor [Hellea balneolensis]